MNKLKIHTFETKLLNNFKVLKKFTSYLNDDDMIICNSCGGWIEGQY